jgi:nucleoside-diphosphate-sugar epimerase
MGYWPKSKDFPIEYFPIDEKHPDYPTSEYGLTKVMGEEMCRAYTQAFGIQTACLRICTIVHPGEYAKWGDHVRQPERWGNMWVYLDVRDAAEGFRLAVENETFRHEVFYMTASTSGVETPAEELIARFFPHVTEIAPDLRGDHPLISSDKARKMLGFDPKYTWQNELGG